MEATEKDNPTPPTHTDKKELEERIIDILRTVYDPEIPVDIYELGLIYEVKIDDEYGVEIVMTLTSPSCPVAESLPIEVEQKTNSVQGVRSAKVTLTFEPPWEKEMMSEAAQLELGFM
jgi:FeS assembly SUF system protein